MKRESIRKLLDQKPYTAEQLRKPTTNPRVIAINKRFAAAKELDVEVNRILKKPS